MLSDVNKAYVGCANNWLPNLFMRYEKVRRSKELISSPHAAASRLPMGCWLRIWHT